MASKFGTLCVNPHIFERVQRTTVCASVGARFDFALWKKDDIKKQQHHVKKQQTQTQQWKRFSYNFQDRNVYKRITISSYDHRLWSSGRFEGDIVADYQEIFYDENRGESKETSFGIKEQKFIHGTMRLWFCASNHNDTPLLSMENESSMVKGLRVIMVLWFHFYWWIRFAHAICWPQCSRRLPEALLSHHHPILRYYLFGRRMSWQRGSKSPAKKPWQIKIWKWIIDVARESLAT